jgi:radical SAM superfamily enzyme YgiQ (UPF0313 family)
MRFQKVLLVTPHETEQDGFTNPPLGLLYLAGTLLKHGFDVRIVDGCLQGITAVQKGLEEFNPHIVGITCLTPGRKKVMEIARMVKKYDHSIKVVLGGAHPSIMYNQIIEQYPEVDYVVIGEGEITLLEIARGDDISQISGMVYRSQEGKPVKNRSRNYVENLDDLPQPAWHLIDVRKYPARGKGFIRGINLSKEPRVSVIFSRGCKGHCDFCSTWWIWRGWRHRSAKNMVDEIELLYKDCGVKHFCFADDALTVDRQATIALCDEILARNLNIAFTATTRTDCVDEELLRKLKQAGCYEMGYGIETGSSDLLDKMRKENHLENSEIAIRLSKKIGIKTTALIIVGSIGETHETIQETVLFLQKSKPDLIGCAGSLWILPGTKVYQYCKKQGFIDDNFWLSEEPYKIYTLEHSREELNIMTEKIYGYDFNHRLKRILTVLKNKILKTPKTKNK